MEQKLLCILSKVVILSGFLPPVFVKKNCFFVMQKRTLKQNHVVILFITSNYFKLLYVQNKINSKTKLKEKNIYFFNECKLNNSLFFIVLLSLLMFFILSFCVCVCVCLFCLKENIHFFIHLVLRMFF